MFSFMIFEECLHLEMFSLILYVECLLNAFWIVLEPLVNQHTANVDTNVNLSIKAFCSLLN